MLYIFPSVCRSRLYSLLRDRPVFKYFCFCLLVLLSDAFKVLKLPDMLFLFSSLKAILSTEKSAFSLLNNQLRPTVSGSCPYSGFTNLLQYLKESSNFFFLKFGRLLESLSVFNSMYILRSFNNSLLELYCFEFFLMRTLFYSSLFYCQILIEEF